jgi:hypothetical protein
MKCPNAQPLSAVPFLSPSLATIHKYINYLYEILGSNLAPENPT